MPKLQQAGFRRISDQSVLKRTGKASKDWTAVLDSFNVAGRGHTAAAKFLEDEHKLSPWWAQCVVIRYEWEHGLRKE